MRTDGIKRRVAIDYSRLNEDLIMQQTRVRAVVLLSSCLILCATIWAGCGFERFAPPLEDLGGITLSELEEIQNWAAPCELDSDR